MTEQRTDECGRRLHHQMRNGEAIDVAVGNTTIRVDLPDEVAEALSRRYAERGVLHAEQLAEWALTDPDLCREAELAGIEPLTLAAYFERAVRSVDPERIAEFKDFLTQPHGLGQIDPDSLEYEELQRQLGGEPIRFVKVPELLEMEREFVFPWWLPKGPIHAVDLRPYLGDARDQGGRGTCTAFGSTAVVEALEYLRDRRPGPRDLAEQLVFWYSKNGRLNTGGGYGCAAALRHQSEYGAVEEFYAPYRTNQIDGNHAQVPISDESMDRAQFYRTGEVIGLPARDVEAVKTVLRSGRCVGIIHDATDWNTSTGTYTFPEPLDSKDVGGNHCTAIVGYIDRDDLPDVFEGGYFIQRNSWGRANSPSNVMGPEYGGHLLMPYGWYRRYTHSAYTVRDRDGEADERRDWLVEYFDNENLQGAPVEEGRFALGPFNITVDLPDEVPDVDFNWGGRSPVTFNLFGAASVDMLPTDHFSARFTKIERLRSGWYRFVLSGDDGVRLWVDDRLVINGWRAQPRTTYESTVYLTGGDHRLRVEYYERTGQANLSLDIHPVVFDYELFANSSLAGSPVDTFGDTATDLEWRHAPPVSTPGQHGAFSLRSTAQLDFEAGRYRFNALQTGGCRLYVDDDLVFDDWDASTPTVAPDVELAGGSHTVRAEFRHTDTVPAPGVKGYYRAALNFGWEQRQWHADLHHDDRRSDFDDGTREVDHNYIGSRVLSLTDPAVWSARYDAEHSASGEYRAVDGPDRVELLIANEDQFTENVSGAGSLPENYYSLWIRRTIFVPEPGIHQFELEGGGYSRLTINGKQVLDDHVGGKPHSTGDVFLPAGMVDIGIEWAISHWSRSMKFRLKKAAWYVTYHEGDDFGSYVGAASLDDVNQLVTMRPDTTPSVFSATARRNIELPVGRYRFQTNTKGGVRLKLGGEVVIDDWRSGAGVNSYDHEHKGGDLLVEVEYFGTAYSGSFHLEYRSIGYFAEYFKGTGLEIESPVGLDRNVPIAYRYDDSIQFDWGRGNRLDRIGSDLFSARWRGRIDLPVGRWECQLISDDGVRLYVDGRLVIDEWRDQSATTKRRRVDLAGREHEVKVEYYERSGSARCELKFQRIL